MKVWIWLFIGILIVSSVLADNSICKTTITNLAFSPQSPGAKSIVTVSFKIDTQFVTGPSANPLPSSVHFNVTQDGNLVSAQSSIPANIAPIQYLGEYYPATVSFTFSPENEGAYVVDVFGYPGLASLCQGTLTDANTDAKSVDVVVGAPPAFDLSKSSDCQSAGFHWTGTQCCVNDTSLYYEDSGIINPASGGGCWAGNYIAYGETAMNGRVINYKGNFVPCAPSTAPLLVLPTGNHQDPVTIACNSNTVLTGATKISGENAVCGSDGKWNIFTSSAENLAVSSVGWQSAWSLIPAGKKISGCCPQDQCWSGSSCVDVNSALKIDSQGYKCIPSTPQSSWAPAVVQSTWDKIENGFCAQDTQCLLNPSGNPSNDGQPELWFASTPLNQPKCINDGQSILDHYCSSGQWTSRTKILAANMIARAEKPFTLICGSPDVLLLPNATETIKLANTIKSPVVKGSRTFPAGNNVCILRSGAETFFGSALNVPPSDAKSIVSALNIPNYCNAFFTLAGVGELCRNTGDFSVYYDSDSNSVIIKSSAPSVVKGTFAGTIAYITNAFSSITAYTKTITSTSAKDYSIFDQPGEFSNLFISDTSRGKMMAFMETNQTQFRTTYLGMKFENMDLKDNPCIMLFKSFDDISKCENQLDYKSNGFFILAAQANENTKLINSWADLTSKLRLL